MQRACQHPHESNLLFKPFFLFFILFRLAYQKLKVLTIKFEKIKFKLNELTIHTQINNMKLNFN